jgi:hypothetical protein
MTIRHFAYGHTGPIFYNTAKKESTASGYFLVTAVIVQRIKIGLIKMSGRQDITADEREEQCAGREKNYGRKSVDMRPAFFVLLHPYSQLSEYTVVFTRFRDYILSYNFALTGIIKDAKSPRGYKNS